MKEVPSKPPIRTNKEGGGGNPTIPPTAKKQGDKLLPLQITSQSQTTEPCSVVMRKGGKKADTPKNVFQKGQKPKSVSSKDPRMAPKPAVTAKRPPKSAAVAVTCSQSTYDEVITGEEDPLGRPQSRGRADKKGIDRSNHL